MSESSLVPFWDSRYVAGTQPCSSAVLTNHQPTKRSKESCSFNIERNKNSRMLQKRQHRVSSFKYLSILTPLERGYSSIIQFLWDTFTAVNECAGRPHVKKGYDAANTEFILRNLKSIHKSSDLSSPISQSKSRNMDIYSIKTLCTYMDEVTEVKR